MKRKRSRPASEPPWTPFAPAHLPPGAHLPGDMVPERVLLNSRYQVLVFEIRFPLGLITWLSIKRLDKGPIRDWRDMQRLKNEVCGPEREACELYPAESRLVDASNQYHLWVLPEGERFPFGFATRGVSEVAIGSSKQRPWDPDNRPPDLITQEELLREADRVGGWVRHQVRAGALRRSG